MVMMCSRHSREVSVSLPVSRNNVYPYSDNLFANYLKPQFVAKTQTIIIIIFKRFETFLYIYICRHMYVQISLRNSPKPRIIPVFPSLSICVAVSLSATNGDFVGLQQNRSRDISGSHFREKKKLNHYHKLN